jgi:hypothetical protein
MRIIILGWVNTSNTSPAHAILFLGWFCFSLGLIADWYWYFVVQRGGQGNVHLDEASLKEKKEKEKEKKKSLSHEGLADKLKNKLLGRK